MRITREIQRRRGAREKDGETIVDERRMSEEGCEGGCRGGSPGVCPPGRGERAVTERDGVTKGGIANALEWDMYLLLSSRQCFAEEGAYRHGAHGNAQAPSAEDPRPFDECLVLSRVLFVISLSPSLYHVPLLSLALPPFLPFALCLPTRLSVFVFIISHPIP